MFCSYYFVSTFFSSSDILFSPCSTLLMRLVSFWASLPLSLPLSFFLAVLRFELRTACCLLGRCSYHLIHFSSPFLRFSFTEFQLFFQNFSFISCISSLLHSVVYLYSFLIHSGVLFNFSDHSNHSFDFIVWDFIHFTIYQILYCGIIDFWRRLIAIIVILLVFLHWDLWICDQVFDWRF
jgi:hypothetical protein